MSVSSKAGGLERNLLTPPLALIQAPR